MKQRIYKFCLSLLLYWFVASFANHVLEFPDKVISIASFVPPVLGLMWGLPAAAGVYIGALLVVPELRHLFATAGGVGDWSMYFVRAGWTFLAGWLPYFLWHKWPIPSEPCPFFLSVGILKKFILIMMATFVVTSAYRALTVTPEELTALAGLLGSGRMATPDFFLAVFVDLAWFFFLVSRGFPFDNPLGTPFKPSVEQDERTAAEKSHAWRMALGFYMFFPAVVLYVDNYQIYGMDRIGTWLPFMAQCLALIDVYLVLMLYLLLRYRRSIMVEVVFLVTQTVFFTATVLGAGNSVAMGNLVKSHTDESLHAMSTICRERLYQTFFCVRQAVNGMKLQAVDSVESYDRLANDADYRAAYIARMKNDFSFISLGTAGSISYYLRLIPEIAGTKGSTFALRRT